MESAKLVFTGDIGFDKYMDGKWRDEQLIDEELMDFLHKGDHVIVNVEGAVSEQKQIIRPNGVAALVHTMNPEATGFLERIGADVWNICNNHIMDAGGEGMADTLKKAAQCNVRTLGAGMNIDEAAKPVIFPEAGGIGLIGVGYQRACRKADENTPGCLSWSDMDRIQSSINEVKRTCRWCVIVAHGGEEFTALPMPYTRDRYIEYLNMGADVVVSHHPHVPMNYETFPGKAIFYSLGNFVFDTDYQRSQFNTEYGIVLGLEFTRNDFSFEAKGLRIDRDNERVVSEKLPEIFEDVQGEEYDKLLPLAAKMFIENTKRQLKYLKPAEYENASEDDFVKNFYEPLRSGRVPGEVLDMQIVYPLSLEETKGEWKGSRHKAIIEYMRKQIP